MHHMSLLSCRFCTDWIIHTKTVFIFSDKSGRSKLDIKLPTGSKFKYFSKTQDGTEFQAELNLNGE